MPVAVELECAARRHLAASLHRAGEQAPHAPWPEPTDTVYLYGGGSGRILAAYRVQTLLDGEHPDQGPEGLVLEDSGRRLSPAEAGRLYAWLRQETLLPAYIAKTGHRERLSPLAR